MTGWFPEPTDWLALATELTRPDIAEHDPKAVDRVSAAPAGEQPSCSVTLLDSRRRPA